MVTNKLLKKNNNTLILLQDDGLEVRHIRYVASSGKILEERSIKWWENKLLSCYLFKKIVYIPAVGLPLRATLRTLYRLADHKDKSGWDRGEASANLIQKRQNIFWHHGIEARGVRPQLRHAVILVAYSNSAVTFGLYKTPHCYSLCGGQSSGGDGNMEYGLSWRQRYNGQCL